MQAIGIVYTAIIFAMGLFLTFGGYMLQRDKYWRRVWKELGEPEVGSIEELKALQKAQAQSVPGRKAAKLVPEP